MSELRSLLLLAVAAHFSPRMAAQSIQIYSEFQRIGPFGQVIPQDRSPSPREIISPATARNAYSSFHVAVSVPPGQNYFLYFQANPPHILDIRLYKEHFAQDPSGWIPDALTPTASPSFGVIPEADPAIPNQTTRDYLLDIYTPPDAEPGRRVRVEVLLKYGTWYVAPFELRIMDPVVHAPPRATPAQLPAVDASADSAAVQALADYLADVPEWNRPDVPGTVRDVLRRNAQQDMALAFAGRSPIVWLRAADQIVNGWTLFSNGSEWYLRVRDFLISRPHP
jgi:hypothetical protein